jgi:hypothetical protein
VKAGPKIYQSARKQSPLGRDKGDWLATGAQIVVRGHRKDMLITSGHHVWPADIEKRGGPNRRLPRRQHCSGAL